MGKMMVIGCGGWGKSTVGGEMGKKVSYAVDEVERLRREEEMGVLGGMMGIGDG